MGKLIERDLKNAVQNLGENPYRIVTVLDLENFRKRLMNDLTQLLEDRFNTAPKKWLRSYEVRKILNISPGTLQHLKAEGILPFSKVGGSHYYDFQKIQELLSAKETNSSTAGIK